MSRDISEDLEELPDAERERLDGLFRSIQGEELASDLWELARMNKASKSEALGCP